MIASGNPSPRVCVLTAAHNCFDQRVFYKEAVSLAEAGFEVTIIGPAPAHQRGLHKGVYFEPLPVPTTRWRRFASHGRLLRLAWRVQADIYHFHDPELLPLGCILRVLRRRVVYDVHENFAAVSFARRWVPRLLRRPLSCLVEIAERGMAAQLNGVVGVVDEQRTRFPHCPFAAVHNYPRLEWFAPRRRQRSRSAAVDDEAELIHVGSLSHERGAHFLLEVMRALRQTHPTVRLNALGVFHTRADEIAFENTVQEFGLHNCVSWRTARVPYDELGSYVARHRIGLIPGQVSAKNLTPFVPTKLFEYLACGIPVVASALPSIVRLRALGEWGIIVDPADPAAHAAAIAGLLDDPQEAERLGGCGRALVESACNWESEALKLLGLYGELLDGQVAVNGTIAEAAS
jgi:glycosyltransferase involved in cell wall biosynthesis